MYLVKENPNIHHVAKRGQPSQWGRGGQCQSKMKSIVPKVKSNYNKLDHPKLMALIQAKRYEYIEGLNMVDLRDQFKSVKCRMGKIANSMNVSGHAFLLRNNVICKDKWGVMYEDFKHIFDYTDSIGNNIGYWDFIPQEKNKFECVSTIQKSDVQIDRIVHGGVHHVASFAFVWSNGIVWQCY